MKEPNKLTLDPNTELDNLFAISQVISQSDHWKPALDKIVPLLRAILIYDNLVLYLPDAKNQQIEVVYARVVGRGRSAGPDLNWGEAIARQVFETGQVAIQQPETVDNPTERLNFPYLCSLPITMGDLPLGVLVLIRFGGPAYTQEDIRIVSFLANGLSRILEYLQIKQKMDLLEAEQAQEHLQEDFVSTITHELLTPLGFIKGYTTTLMRSDTTWDESTQREFLNIIDQETDRLQELIDNMLDSARLQSGTMQMQFQPVRLDALLKDVTMRAHMHHKDVTIDLHIDGVIAPIQGDPRRLTQVFENLLSNAVKYAPGSPLTITLQDRGEFVHIAFQDSGPGIPPQYVPHLFERFFRNPEQAPNVRGTGLGLYICRQIAEAHQGKISVESYLGEGTTIHMELPHEQQQPKSSSRFKNVTKKGDSNE